MNAFYQALIVLVVAAVLALIFKIYLKLSVSWDRSPTCLVGKTAVVTGSNTGIGYETALDFAKRGARVVLACRDRARGEQAKCRIVEETGNEQVVLRIVDTGSLASVRKFAQEMRDGEARLDILVNNAGTSALPQVRTADGLGQLMQVNHYGPFLLTILLLDLLKKSAPSRVVVVSSALASVASLNVDNLDAFPRGPLKYMFEYANTKLCNVLFANELARRLKGTGVTVNSIHPGAVQTEVLKHSSSLFQSIMGPLMAAFYKSVQEGAQTTIYASVSKEAGQVTGQYFSECAVSRMPRNGDDAQLAQKLWEKSEISVKLSEEEKRHL